MKKYIAMLSSILQHYRKEVARYLLGVLLIFGGLVLGFASKDDYDKIENTSVIACVLSEGFETACDLDVNVHFTDTGKIAFQFNPLDYETMPQTAWANIFSSTDYTEFDWAISGNVEHREFHQSEDNLVTSSRDTANEGTGFFMEFFKITVNSDGIPEEICLQLDPESVIYQRGDIVRIRTPYVGSIPYNSDMIPDDDFTVSEVIQNLGEDAFERVFSFGKIDGKPLTPASLQVTGTYDSEKLYYDPSYKLEHISPISGKRGLQSVSWEPERFILTPIIEYKAKTSGIFDSFIAFLMISVGSFLLPIPLEQLYADAMESKGTRRKKRKG